MRECGNSIGHGELLIGNFVIAPLRVREYSDKLRVFADWAVEAFAAKLGATKFPGDKSLKR
jgi:hypothetical protein